MALPVTDSHADDLKAALSAYGVETGGLIADAGRPTTTKTRVIAAHQQVVRVDEESTEPISEAIVADVLKAVKKDLGRLPTRSSSPTTPRVSSRPNFCRA